MATGTQEPGYIQVGSSVRWTIHAPDHPPPDYELTYYFTTPATKVEVTATDNGDGRHLVALDPAKTGEFAVTQRTVFPYVAYAAKDGERYLERQGQIEIRPDLTEAGADDRSHVKRTLDAVRAVLENRAAKTDLSWSIAGRALSKMSHDQLLDLEKEYSRRYTLELRAESRRRTGRNSSLIKGVFTS